MPVTIFRRVNIPSVADFESPSDVSAQEWFGSQSLAASMLPASMLPPGPPLSLWGSPLDRWCAGERCTLREAIEHTWSYDSQIASYHVPLLWPAAWRISKAVLPELPEPWRPIAAARALGAGSKSPFRGVQGAIPGQEVAVAQRQELAIPRG